MSELNIDDFEAWGDRKMPCKNSNEPIVPVINMGVMLTTGLTKREEFASRAMQGILAYDVKHVLSPNEVSDWAIRNADALLRGLDK